MPTFESIPLDPALKQQLLTPPNPDGVSISTPQALLSRTPQALADQLLANQDKICKGGRKIGNDEMLKQMDTLRSQVAHAMLAQTMMGKFRLQQQKLYDDSMVQQYYYDTENTTSTEQYYATRPLVLGATVSAMQAWQQEQERKGPITSLSTGCRAMDELLSLPSEYSNHSHYNVQERNNQPQEHSHHHGGMLGFPRGHVLCFSGLSGSGKSQWCLQISAQALRQHYKSSRRRPVVRYCYSSAGHNGNALAQRLSQLLQYQVSPMSNTSVSSSSSLSRALEKIEFQPMRTTTQLIATLKALEEELLLQASSYGTTKNGPVPHANKQGDLQQPPFVLIVDSLSNLDVQGNPSQISRLYRNLRRLARQYSLWVVVALSEAPPSTNSNNLLGDYHVVCQSLTTTTTTSTTTTIQATVGKHPTKFEQSSITLFHTPSGMSTRASPVL